MPCSGWPWRSPRPAPSTPSTRAKRTSRRSRPRRRPAGSTRPRRSPPASSRTLERLADLIVPADDKPGALQAEVAPWIDMLLNVNADLKAKYTTGLAWLDTAIAAQGAKDFASATPAQQTALLDVIAYKKNRTPENAAGIDFFVLARRMTCDGFYTSTGRHARRLHGQHAPGRLRRAAGGDRSRAEPKPAEVVSSRLESRRRLARAPRATAPCRSVDVAFSHSECETNRHP